MLVNDWNKYGEYGRTTVESSQLCRLSYWTTFLSGTYIHLCEN